MNIIEESGDSSVNGIGDENVEVLDRSIENIYNNNESSVKRRKVREKKRSL